MVKFVVMAMEPKIMIFDSATSLSFCALPLPNCDGAGQMLVVRKSRQVGCAASTKH
jgi:hypothetical protein